MYVRMFMCRSISFGEVAMFKYSEPSLARNPQPCLQTEEEEVLHRGNYVVTLLLVIIWLD